MKITILISLLLLSIFRLPASKVPASDSYSFKSLDTSRYSILKYNRERDYGIFKDAKPAPLSNTEIQNILGLINKRVTEYNKSERKGIYPLIIKHPEKYYKQFIAVINTKGEKEVWVNCLCSIEDSHWKKNVVYVLDGGSCYFNLKINLTKNTIYDFNVNGVA